jgi:hypothetical protein
MGRRGHDPVLRRRAIDLLESGKSVREVAEEPAGLAKKKMCRWAPPSPHLDTCARAICGSDSIALARCTTNRPISAAMSSGRSLRSKCCLGSRINRRGAPVGAVVVLSLHRESDHSTPLSDSHAWQSTPPSPLRAG